MIKFIDIHNVSNAEEVLQLQRVSYQKEAEIIDYYDLPPLKDTVESLISSGEIFIGYYSHHELWGMIAVELKGKEMTICRLVVHPSHFRKGIAESLLDFVLDHFDYEQVEVSTGAKNTPAVKFYIKNGFRKIKDVIVNDRLSLSFFQLHKGKQTKGRTAMLRVGIVGLGAIGQRLLKQFNEHKEIEIVAVCDQLASLAESTAASLNGAKAYTNYQELIADEKVDLVYVAVPPKFHYSIVMAALRGKKHILCEKPLANSLEEAKEMFVAAKEASVIHAMNFPLNYSQGAVKFEKLIRENYIGKLHRLQLTMHFPQWPRYWQQNNWVGGREQGGFILEVGVHFIQQTLKIFGDVRKIQSRLEFSHDPNQCETGVIAIGELVDGTPFLVDGLSNIVGNEYIGFTAYGTEGVLSLDNWGELRGGKVGQFLEDIPLDDVVPNRLLDELIKAVNGQEGEIYDFEVGFKAQEILEQLRK